MTERTSEDYAPYCRGQQVCVQLRQQMLLCERGGGGDIELMKSYEVQPAEWMQGLSDAFKEANGREPTDGELQEMLSAKPPPVRPVSVPVYVGELEKRGPFLVGNYQDGGGKNLEFIIDPRDVLHITVLKDGLIES